MTLDPLLSEIHAAAQALHSQGSNDEAIRRISKAFQAIHSVASIARYEEVAAFTGHLDYLLGQIRDGIVPVTDPLPGVISAAADQVKLLLIAEQGGPPVDVSLQAALLETAFQMAEPSLPAMKSRELEEEASVQDAIVLSAV